MGGTQQRRSVCMCVRTNIMPHPTSVFLLLLPTCSWVLFPAKSTPRRYDAGDMTKFTFPAAFAVANLALAFLEFPDAFKGDAEKSLLSSLKWEADWLLAARYAPDAFVAVTWAPGKTIKESHNWWGKPEEVRVCWCVVG